MEAYETDDDYTGTEILNLSKWFNDTIGTESEIQPSASGEEDEYYIIFLDLTLKDVRQVRAYELKFREDNNK